MEWTEELIGQLRVLWNEGRSTAEIGRHIGMSKNAVVGKAHRLNLTARPSPIRREAGCAPPRLRPATREPTLPPLSASRLTLAREPLPAKPYLPPRAPLSPRPGLPPEGEPLAVAAQPASAGAPLSGLPRGGRAMACCWPLGEPGTAEFHFCGGAAMPGKPYCAAHAQIAYVRLRDRRDDAA